MEKTKNFDEFIIENEITKVQGAQVQSPDQVQPESTQVQPEGTPIQQPVKNNGRYIYIVIDKESHSYEAILGVYDNFDKAMASGAWSVYGETPDKDGYGVNLFIYKEELNKDLTPVYQK